MENKKSFREWKDSLEEWEILFILYTTLDSDRLDEALRDYYEELD